MEEIKEDVVRRGFSRELPVKLGETERNEAGKRWADRDAEREALKMQKADAVASFDRRKADIETDMKLLRDEFRYGERIMPVECYERFVSGMIEVVRVDTGEVIDRRAASTAERQRNMDHNFQGVWDDFDPTSHDSLDDEHEGHTPIEKAKKKAKR